MPEYIYTVQLKKQNPTYESKVVPKNIMCGILCLVGGVLLFCLFFPLG